MSVNNESEKQTKPRPWNEHSSYNTYVEADQARTSFLEKNTKMQAKVKRRHAKNKYSLKTRLLAEFVKQETKKRGKSKRRNKKNPNGGKSDSSSAV